MTLKKKLSISFLLATLTPLLVGSLVWAYTLFLPSFGPGGILSESIMVNGPWGLE